MKKLSSKLAVLITAIAVSTGSYSSEEDFLKLADLAADILGGNTPTAEELQPLENVRKDVAKAMGMEDAPSLDLNLISGGIKILRMTPLFNGSTVTNAPSHYDFNMTEEETVLFVRDLMEAAQIVAKANARAEIYKHRLAEEGYAEEPASEAAIRYEIDTGSSKLKFDKYGELFVDRRFLSDDEMKAIKRVEQDYRAEYARTGYAEKGEALPESREAVEKKLKVPIFRGFEDDRYQMHDDLIVKLVAAFNANKAAWIGGTELQAAKVADLTPALVKSHMIEESGGNGPSSRAAWSVDPMQVNVPGDWDPAKKLVGLSKPSRRNQGTPEANIRAAIKWLARKGFGASGKPAGERPKGFFDGWKMALRRYNARKDRTKDGRAYKDAYADKIMRRAKNPERFYPVEIKIK